ncbi:MAG: ROK family protein [Rhodothermaceae bacterium]|nr:ROK family protein [Rhodothermaceae bacterium]
MPDPSPVVAGIDIGGTTIKAGLVTREGAVRDRFTLPTAGFPDPRRLVTTLIEAIRMRLRGHVLVGVGVGAPNGNVYWGTIEQPPNLPWPGVTPLADWLAAEAGVPCVLTNDANAAALGEMLFGDAQGMRHFLLITLGTGVGSGIVVDGKLVAGHRGFAGELGHVIVEPGGRLCGCGRRGCLEPYASANGFERTYQDLTGTAREGEEVMALAADGDALAQETIDRTARVLGRALANSVAYTEPEAIFLFGGLASAGDQLLGPVREQFEAHLFPLYRGHVALRCSGLHAGDAALFGAASLIWTDQP